MPSSFPRAARLAVAVAAAAGLAACGGPAGTQSRGPTPPTRTIPDNSPAGPAGTAPAAQWPQFGNGAARAEVATGLPAAGHLSVAWHTKLDGAVYGQPLVVGGHVIVATENDSFYALSRATGAVIWRAHVGAPVPLSALPCGDIDPLGITGTPVYDAADGLVYAVAETSGYRHVLFGMSATTGQLKVERDIPAPDGHPRYDQQRPALAIEDGRVYVAFGGLEGDCGPYIGSVVGVPVSGAGPLISYRVPTTREGAIWGTAGPVTGPDGTLYVSVGNGAATSGPFDGSDSVTALSPGLRRTGVFAPSVWADDNANDLDLGSTQPALLPDGMLLAVGKRGTGYLVRASKLGGVGGQVAQGAVCKAFGAAAVSGTTVYEPCEHGGMTAVSTSGNAVRVLWHGPAAAWGSPVLGGGAIFVTDWTGGTMYELNPATGAVRDSVSLGGTLPHFSSISLAGPMAFTGTMDGVTAVRGV